MITIRRNRRLAAAAFTLALAVAACGGGGGGGQPAGGPSPADDPVDDPAPAAVAFIAQGAAADSVSLAWQPPAGRAIYAIERQRAGGDWVAVATVDARSGAYLDSGLSAQTDYGYRLVDTGPARTTLAQGAAKTTDEEPVASAAGAALADAASSTVGTAGGTLRSPDGAIAVEVPAGALAADAQASAQPVSNTAPDGRGHGLKVGIAAVPGAALKLTLRYDRAEDAEADGQRIAVQRGDGRWLSLPRVAIDKSARTLTAELPPSLLAVPAAAGASPAGLAGPRIEFTVDRYLAFYLRPQQARLAVKRTLPFTPVARVRGLPETCGIEARLPDFCLPALVMQVREIPFPNAKAGYERRWTVAGIDGGNASVGTVAPDGATGATFSAPARKPSPATVSVGFHSRHVASGRTVTLAAPVEITDDRWTGTMTAETPPSDAGTTFVAIARVDWAADEGASTDTRTVYRASGDVDVVVADDACTVSISPSNHPVDRDVRLVELVVDEAQRTYTARLITFWPATLSARCPAGSATQSTLAGYGWDVHGALGADGSRIEGRQVNQNGAKIEWSFTRPTAGTP